ncbi:MAG TPA: DUF1152 domain-containing protein [Solirubrobacteraceae bacterium]|nr:DUF1152 domain-containing protein [Solirubrobacteraceae bacterium]
MHPLFGHARGVLAVGIGGGGDVVGALAVAELAAAAGLPARVGGVTWERRPIDPLPGPRRLDEIEGADPLADGVVLAGQGTRGPGGFLFAESNMARVLGEPVVLVDPHGGPRAVAAGLDAAAERLRCDLVALVDVGGDVLGHGDEPGLASPLCDAVMLAASAHMRTRTVGAVFGPGCDGELTPDEVLERVAEVARAGGLLGAWGLTPDVTTRLEAVVQTVPTEASAQALRCARGEYGASAIRGGRRPVQLSPVGAVTFFFDPAAAMASAARLATAVAEAGSLEEAQATLAARGVRTELQWERDAAAAPPAA